MFARHECAFLPIRKRRDLVAEPEEPAVWLKETIVGAAVFRVVRFADESV
jgi:hypothetical protein